MKDKHKAMTVRKSIFKRITSFFLAFMVAILCVPSNALEAGAFWWGWGAPIISPNTITNASIKFKDEAANVITEVESGDPFSIVITISGSNVFQMYGGGKTEYTVEITDKNLLLTNFKDNGFFDGAKYNGYKLNYDKTTGKRTITFSVKNGSTKTIQLSARFANGTTEGGNPATVKLVNKSTYASLSGSITPIAKLEWGLGKTENKTEISSADFESGDIQYSLSAKPNYVSDGTGELWATGIKFSDTIELSSGMEFTSREALQSALSIPGAENLEITEFSSNKATVTWTVTSAYLSGSDNKPYAEMDAYNATATLKLNCINITSSDFESGTLKNTLSGKASFYGSDGYEIDLSESSVQAAIKATKPDFSTIGKSISSVDSETYSSKGYFMPGDEVTFLLTTKNSGGKAGNVTLTENPDSNLSYLKWEEWSNSAVSTASGDGTTFTFNNVPAGSTVGVLVTYEISNSITSDTSLSNTVKNDAGYSATAYVPVKVPVSDIGITKSASTNSLLMGTATDVTYRITVSNNGTTELTGVSLTDVLSGFTGTAVIKSMTIDGTADTSLDGKDISSAQTIFSGKSLAAGQAVTVVLVVTTTATATGTFTNTAETDSDQTASKDDETSDITVSEATPNITASKSGYVLNGTTQQGSYHEVNAGETNNQKLVWVINVSNTGTGSATNVAVSDAPEGTIEKVTLSYNGTETDITTEYNSGYTIPEIAPGKTAQIKITVDPGTVENGESAALKNTAAVDGDTYTGSINYQPLSANIGIWKSALKGTYLDGGSAAVENLFKIVVSNTGTLNAANVVVTDTIDTTMFSGVQYSIDDGATWSDWNGSYTINVLNADSSVTILLRGKCIDTGGTLTNTAGWSYDGKSGTSSASIYKTTYDAGNASKSATVLNADGTTSSSVDVSGGTIQYDIRYDKSNYLTSGSDKLIFPITFTDTLPDYSIEYWNVSKVELIADGGTATEVTDYTLSGNILKYTTPADFTCDNNAVLRITYNLESLANMDGGAPTEVKNNAVVEIAGKTINVTASTPVVDKNAMKVDKFAKVEGSVSSVPDPMDADVINLEAGNVNFGTVITNYITVTNTSQKAWNTVNVYDIFTGRYNPETMEADDTFPFAVYVADVQGSDVVSAGDKFTAHITHFGNVCQRTDVDTSKAYTTEFSPVMTNWTADGAQEKNGFYIGIKSDDTVLEPGGSITFAYQIVTYGMPYNYNSGNMYKGGTNTVWSSYSGNAADLSGGSVFTDAVEFLAGAPMLAKSMTKTEPEKTEAVWENSKSTLKYTGFETDGNLTESISEGVTADDLDTEYNYVLVLDNNNNAQKVTFGSEYTYVINDAVPDGMEIVSGSVHAYHVAEYSPSYTANYEGSDFSELLNEVSSITLNTDVSTGTDWVDGTAVGKLESLELDSEVLYNSDGTVSFVVKNAELAEGARIAVVYKLKLTENAINDIIASQGAGEAVYEKFVNTAYAEMYLNYGTPQSAKIITTAENDAVLTLKEKSIAPGVKKDGDSIDYLEVTEYDSAPGVEWTVSVYNGDGSAKYAAGGEEEIDTLEGYTITDVMTEGFKYYGQSGYDDMTAKWQIYNIAQDGTLTAVSGSEGTITPTVDGTEVTAPTAGNITFTAIDAMKLSANQCIKLTFITSSAVETQIDGETFYIADAGKAVNEVSVKFDQGFSEELIIAGENKGEKTLWASASHQIGGIDTDSYKAIFVTDELEASISGYGSNLPDIVTDKNVGFGDLIPEGTLTGTTLSTPFGGLNAGLAEGTATNYVQGLQGELVYYTLNVRNNDASDPLEKFVIIDRLPVLNDYGLVSGDYRDSAFAVTLNPESIKATIYDENGNASVVTPKITYSADSMSALTEYDADWIGQDGIMTWSDTYTPSMANFRLEFGSDVIPAGGYVVVEFNATVPQFVDRTGEENVAWNSFAYGYQSSNVKTGLSAGEVVISEPARVGVWVDKTDTTITVEKTYISNNTTDENTFYFALFTKKDDDSYEMLGQPKSLKLVGSNEGTTGTVEFKNIQATDTLYVFEVDVDGNILKSTPEQTVHYGENEFTDDTVELGNSLEAAYKATVSFTTSDSGITGATSGSSDITVANGTITLSGEAVTAGNKITISSDTGAFMCVNNTNLGSVYGHPNSMTFEANGETINISGGWSQNATGTISIEAPGGQTTLDVKITDETRVGNIEVTKTFIPVANGTKDTFYFTAFTKDGDTFVKSPYTEVQSLTMQGKLAGDEVTGTLSFKNLPVTSEGITYYILETDAQGKLLAAPSEAEGVLTYEYTASGGTVCNVSSDAGIELSTEILSGTCAIKNTEVQTYSIGVTKQYTGTKTGQTFYAAAFTLNEGASAVAPAASNFTIVSGTETELTVGGEIVIEIPAEGEYYIFETDGNGKPLDHNDDSMGYVVSYDSGSVSVEDISDPDDEDAEANYVIQYVPQSLYTTSNEGSVTITNSDEAEKIYPEIEVTKMLNVTGYGTDALPEMTFTFGLFTSSVSDGEIVYTQVGESKTISVTAADGDGEYTATATFEIDTPIGIEPLTYYVFELYNTNILENNDVYTYAFKEEFYDVLVNYDSAGGIVVTQVEPKGTAMAVNSITKEVADLELSFTKWTYDGSALAGAKLSIEGNVASASVSGYEAGTSAENLTEGQYFIDTANGTITWVSSEDAILIKGLDGGYTLTELSAPTDYDKLTNQIYFNVREGIITNSSKDADLSEK